MRTMKAAVFVSPGRIELQERRIPDVGPLDALVRVTTTTICGTDVHILKGEYPVRSGLIVGHEPVGVIEKLGSSVQGYREGQRVIAGAICPSGHSNASLDGDHAQDGAGTPHGWKPIGGWKFGNTIDGCQAEYVLVPDAMANLAPVPRGAHRRAGADVPRHHVHGIRRRRARRHHASATRSRYSRRARSGYARRPAQAPRRHQDHRRGRCAGAAADVASASAQTTSSTFARSDPVEEIMQLTDGRGVDVAIEALGTQSTFEAALRVLRPGGTLSSLGVYSGDLKIPLGRFRSRAGRSRHRHDALPGRQRTHAAADERRRVQVAWISRRW